MPLHLLHHKSYHVYSTTNVERVRRDEAAARAKEEAEEQRMQEADAEHRIRVLRARAAGEDIPTSIIEEDRHGPNASSITGRFVQPRDTAQIGESGAAIVGPPVKRRRTSSDTPLTGADGHINLFGDIENPKRRGKVEKNAEYEAEKKAKEDKIEAQFTMGLGKPAEELKPWYSTLDMVGEVKGRKKTDREVKKDERRKDWGDPLVAIKRGVRGVKEVDEAREEWKRNRELEVGAVGLRALEAEKADASAARARGREHRTRQDKSAETHSRSRHRHRSGSTSRSGHQSHSEKHNRSESNIETASHRHRRRHRSLRSRSPSRDHDSKNDLMQKLRRERDQREKVEREKAEAMLSKEKEYLLPGWKAADGGRYSSQFGIGDVRKR